MECRTFFLFIFRNFVFNTLRLDILANVFFFFFASWLLCGKFFFFKNYAVHDNFINKTMMLTSWSREWKNNWNTGNIFFFNTRWEYRAGRWILLLLYIYIFLIYHDSGKAISVEVNTFRGINTEQLTSIFFLGYGTLG